MKPTGLDHDHDAARDHDRTRARTFTPDRYLDPAFLRREWELLFARTWQLVGPVSDLAAPGDRLVLELGGEGIVVVRGKDGSLRAFHNTCPHRGTRLVPCAGSDPSGIRCPYHGWEWHLDGSVRRISDAATVRTDDPASFRLVEVRCETWAGQVWIHLDPAAPPLLGALGTLAPRVAPYLLEQHALVRDLTVEWPCNWKVVLDNGNETYHVQAVHPQLLELLDDRETTPEIHGDHSCFWVRFGHPSPRIGRFEAVPHELASFMSKVGLDAQPFTGRVERVRSELGRAYRAQFRARGYDYPDLDDDGLVDNFHVHVFPNVMFNVLLPGYWIFRLRPHPHDPARCYFDFQEYERVPAGKAPPPRPVHRTHRAGEVSLDAVLDQDAHIVAEVQKGLSSRACTRVVFGAQETRLTHMHERIDAYLRGEP